MDRLRAALTRGHLPHLLFAAAALGVAVAAGASFGSATAALLVLCPLAMGAMMWWMVRR